MKKIITNNLLFKVLSVMIATTIWLLVANTNDPVVTKRISDIPVEVINQSVLENQGYSYEIIDGQYVSIMVKGKSSVVNALSEKNFRAVADFSKLSVVDAVPIDVTVERYEGQIEISIVSSTNTMKIKKDEIGSANVQVNIDVKGEVAKGYAVGRKTSTPNMIKVSGPKNVIKGIKEIRAEVTVDGITRNISTTAVPKLYDEDGKVIDNNQITMDSSLINVEVELWKTKEVELKINWSGKPAKGYKVTQFDYEPKQILIAAPQGILKDIHEISLKDVNISGKKGTYEETIELTPEIQEDKILVADTNTSVKVKVTIEKVTQKEFTFDKTQLTVRNGDGYMITYDGEGSYTFTAEGTEETLKSLRAEDFEPWINLEDMSSGSHNMNLHLKDIPGVKIVSKPDINVTLER